MARQCQRQQAAVAYVARISESKMLEPGGLKQTLVSCSFSWNVCLSVDRQSDSVVEKQRQSVNSGRGCGRRWEI